MDTTPLFFPINPYIAGNPVGGGEAFIGRADVLREVLRVVRSPHENALVLYGQRRIGKTSVLQELATRLPKEGPYYPVEFDLQDKAALPLSQVLEELATYIAHESALLEPFTWGQDAPQAFREKFLPHVLAHLPDEASLVLLFDEFDVLDNPTETQASVAFFPYLRNLLSLDLKRLKFIFVIGRRPEDLSTQTLSVFKGVKAHHVSLLTPEETAELVHLAERNRSLLWPDETVTYIQNLTGNHPFLTQQLCQVIWEGAYQDEPEESPTIQPSDVEKAIPSTLHTATNSLEWLWNGLQPAERIVASALAEAGPSSITQEQLEQRLMHSGVRVYMHELHDAPRVLQEWALIMPESGGYRFRVELLRRWIAERKPLNRVWEEIERLEPVAENFYKAAYGLYKGGNLAQAIIPLRQAVSLNPNHLRASLLLAQILLAQNEVKEARQWLENLYESHPAAAGPRLIQVLLRQAQITKELNKRLKLYERVLELEPNHSQATRGRQDTWEEVGNAALAIGDPKQAQYAYKQAGLLEKVKNARLEFALQEIEKLDRNFIGETQPTESSDLISTNVWTNDEFDDLKALDNENNINILYQKAREALQRGNREVAKKLLIEVLAQDPDYEEATRYLHLAVKNIDIAELEQQLQRKKEEQKNNVIGGRASSPISQKKIGRYEIQEQVGKGGMAAVYRALDTRLNRRQVALKVLSEQFGQNKELVRRFRNEAFAAARLRHPNIIDVYDFGVEGDRYYIAMPYITSGTLKKILNQKGPLSSEKTVELLAPIADALRQAHQNYLVHRDIKPANILINEWGTPILVDFGIARIMHEVNDMKSNMTNPGTRIGTPYYMSPEQAAGKSVQKAADIYSLGVVLYETVTGQVPFFGKNPKEVRRKHISESPRPPRQINPDIPLALEEVILKALAKEPEERFASADEMAQAMLEAVGRAISVGVLKKRDFEVDNTLFDQSTLVVNSRIENIDDLPNGKANTTIIEQMRTWITDWFRTHNEPKTPEPSNYDSKSSPPKADEDKTAEQITNLFICYQHHISDQRELVEDLYKFLAQEGYELSQEFKMRANQGSNDNIGHQLQQSNLLVVLLSEEAAKNQMMQAVIQDAYDYRKLQELPRILPIRMGVSDPLPSTIEKCLDPWQYVLWQSQADNQQIGQDILATIEGRLPLRQPQPLSRNIEHEQNGHQPEERESKEVIDVQKMLAELEPPSGAYAGPLYVERQDDIKLKQQLDRMDVGTLTTIRGPRQTGKTSLLIKGIQHARQNSTKVVNLDLQRVDRSYLRTPSYFLRYLAEYIVWELELDLERVEQVWRAPLGPQYKLTRLLEDYILPTCDQAGLLLAMDEVDRLLETDFYTDFFGLVRSWHNSRAYSLDSPWRKLHLVLVISTEPSLLIADPNQSPFNVGLRLYLQDFTTEQVRILNQRHGAPLKIKGVLLLMKLLNGHPYLTRKALYILVTESLSWPKLESKALTNESPFADHLRRYHRLLHNNEKLKAGLREVINRQHCSDDMIRYRLERAGLIKGDREHSVCRCELYRMYFEKIL